MYVLESLKRNVEKMTGLGRPDGADLKALVRTRKANAFRLADDGRTPNNPRLPVVLYRGPVVLARSFDPAAIFEELFAANGWQDAWRNGIYDFLHYHSKTHEALGIAGGRVQVRLGGEKGRKIALKAGDVVVLPAGTGHERLNCGDDLLVVGAYPAGGNYDECHPTEEEHDRARRSIPKVAVPRKDPVYGSGGPLMTLWRKSPARAPSR